MSFEIKGDRSYTDKVNPLHKTKNDYAADQVVSALVKELRRGREYEATWWAYEMFDSGLADTAWSVLTRFVIEEVGVASFGLVSMVDVCKRFGTKTAMSLTVISLCRVHQSPESRDLATLVDYRRETGAKLEIPTYAVDHSTKKGMDNIEENLSEEAKLANAGDRVQTKDDAVKDDYFHNATRSRGFILTHNPEEINWMQELQRTLGISPYKFPTRVQDGSDKEDPKTWNPIAAAGGTIQLIEKGTPMDPRKLRVVDGGKG